MTTFVFSGDRLWVVRAADGAVVPAPPPAATGCACGSLPGEGGADGVAVDAGEVAPPEGVELLGLRGLHDQVPSALYDRAQRAFQEVHWRRTHRFCGSCGRALARHATERAMRCEACGIDFFPRLNPVAIVRVTRGREILLARRAAPHFGFFSVIAGFVEAGETLEQTVHREVAEEVGLQVRDVRYFASQPWPFPNNLMIAFTAEHAGGEIEVDGHEIAEAAWFPPEGLPPIPPPLSISRRLIDDFLRQPAG